VIAHAWRWLRIGWWPIFLTFLLVIAGFTRDRACFDRFHLLPGFDRHQTLASIIVLIYVLGHGWLVAVYACLVAQTGEVVPRWRTARAAIGVAWWQGALMLALLAIEYAPGVLWRQIAQAADLCGP
jgi:hypothetical protein